MYLLESHGMLNIHDLEMFNVKKKKKCMKIIFNFGSYYRSFLP